MKLQTIIVVAAMIASLACTGCSSSPGRPGPASEVLPPNQVMEFKLLYAQNCAGCHGADGKGGAAIALANPVFSQLRTTPQFAAPLPTVCALLQCPRSRRVQGECSLTNKSTPWCGECDPGKNPILSATLVRPLIWHGLLAIRNGVRKHIKRTAPPVMEWTAAGGAMPARL